MATLNKQAFWQQHITQWQNSNLSQSEYCKQHKLKPHSLSYHKCKKIGNSKTKSIVPIKSSGFIKLPVPELLPVQEPLTLHFKSNLSLSGITLNNINLVTRLAEVLS